MINLDQNTATLMLQRVLQPWYDSIADPSSAQEAVLHRLISDYTKTNYGNSHGAEQIDNLEDFRRAFPICRYEDYKPLIDQILTGDISSLLWEEPVGWAITRGTTKGESKFIPMTPTDLRMRVSAGRAMMNYVATTKRFDLFSGVNLNLNFPSIVGEISIGEKKIEYGYSSGIYTKHANSFCTFPGGYRCIGRWQIHKRLGSTIRTRLFTMQIA